MRKSWLVSLVLLAYLGISGTVGAATLTEGQLASHRHNLAVTLGTVNGAIENPFDHGSTNMTDYDAVQFTGGSQSHAHSLAASTGTANGLPPYYSLAYIMRVA